MTGAMLLWMAWAACTPVRGPLLQGADLAAADPQFAGIAPDARIGYSPTPGSRRVISAAEVSRLGARFGLSVQPHELCFEYAMEELDRTAVQAVMEQTITGAEIAIEEFAHTRIPQGRIVFAASSLPKAARPDGTVVWRGHVEYGEGLKFMIWARVRIAVTGPRVIALREVAAGQEIVAGDIERRAVRSFPGSEQWIEEVSGAVGRRTLHNLRAGEYLTSGKLQRIDREIARGDAVLVDVAAGSAHLSLEARAESAASVGELVKLRNPKSGKVFEARVTAKGLATLIASPGVMEDKQ